MRASRLSLVSVLLVVACGWGDDDVCTLEGVFGIQVGVQDSASGAWIGQGSTIIAQDGAFRDSVTVPTSFQNDQYVGITNERTGSYLVIVRYVGYWDWSRANVTVREGECGHVRPVELLARLQPVD
jgi:hypothetical protein